MSIMSMISYFPTKQLFLVQKKSKKFFKILNNRFFFICENIKETSHHANADMHLVFVATHVSKKCDCLIEKR